VPADDRRCWLADEERNPVARLNPAHGGRRALHGGTLVLGAVALVLAVAACGPMHTGAAATVGSTRISIAELQADVQQQLALTPSVERSTVARSILTNMIINDLIADGAAAKGVSVSEQEIQAVLTTQRAQNGTDENTAKANGIAPANLHQRVYEALLQNKLGQVVTAGQADAQKAYIDFLDAVAPVQVNPRYGEWDPTTAKFGVVAADPFTAVASSPAPAPAS
jgi:SurA N-terminal domain